MKIAVFLDNATDDFAFFSSADIAGVGWFDGKPMTGMKTLSEVKLKGRNRDVVALKHLALRKEAFGGVIVDGNTGRVFQVDDAGLKFLTSLQKGTPVERLIGGKLTPKRRAQLTEFMALAKRYKLLPEQMITIARVRLSTR
ncbi:MAG: hypothetical protein E6I48_07060 [Chloroflexi bacterium]|nr:MAG: hypothetical protein E6I48_07060 [Chloroflexota bacterium]